MPPHLQRQIDGHTIDITLNAISKKDPTLRACFTHPIHGRFRLSTGTSELSQARKFAADLDLHEFIKEQTDRRRRTRALPTSTDTVPTVANFGANPTLDQLCTWYTTIVMPNRGRKPKTIQSYTSGLADFLYFCRQNHVGRPQQLSQNLLEHFIAWRRKEGDKQKTTKQKIGYVRAVLNRAYHTELLDTLPLRQWPVIKVEDTDIQPLEPADLLTALAAVQLHQARHHLIILCIATTGLRPSDARSLTPQHLDLTRGYLLKRASKTDKLIQIPLGPQLTRQLKNHVTKNRIQPKELLFTDNGHPYGPNTLLRVFQSALAKSNHRCRTWANVKTLRHTFAHIQLNYLHCPITTVQRLMGHADIKTTARYLRPIDAAPFTHALEAFLLNPDHGLQPPTHAPPIQPYPKPALDP